MAIANWETDNLTAWVKTRAHNTGTLGAPLVTRVARKPSVHTEWKYPRERIQITQKHF